MGAYAPESAKREKTWIRKNQQAYIMELATEKWVHMLRKKFRGAIFSRFSTCRFLHIVTSLGGYLTYIWILRENAFFLDPGFISGKWVGMLRIIYGA